jgi:hypothetical protein
LSFLFDDWPSGQAFGPVKGVKSRAPVLGTVANPDLPAAESAADTSQSEEVIRKSGRLAWALATAALLLLTGVNAAWTFRVPLLENPFIGNWLEKEGWSQVEQGGLLKDPQQMQLVSRDMHAHPTRSGILVLSITFVNLAQQKQVYPVLELTLLDGSSQAVARRRLNPADYLRPGSDTGAGLAPNVYLPVLLELGDPGNQAVGFELRFL